MGTASVHTAGVRIGALAGGIIFLLVGLAPAFFLSSAGMLVLLTHMTGGPVEPGVFMRILLVTGSVAGICLAGAIFMMGGATAGLALGHVADAMGLIARQPESTPEGTEEKKL